jgi:hypothetical protein
VDAKDLRDPEAERRGHRLMFIAVVVIVSLALGVAGYAGFTQRVSDHHYRYAFTFTNANNASYILLVPLPEDGELQANWATLGAMSARVEGSEYGTVLRVEGRGNVSGAAYLDTWRDVPIRLTTEGNDHQGRPAARVHLEGPGNAENAYLNLSIREVEPFWTTERFAQADVFDGWNAIAFREEMEPTQANATAT